MDSQPLAEPALTPLEQVQFGRQVVAAYADALETMAGQLDASFCQAAQLLYECTGSVIVSGIGKAGLIGQKIAATLSSIGTRSHFLHPAEAMHGDLGRIHRDDVVMMFSQSGETEEVIRLLPSINEFGVPLLAVTCRPQSTLGRAAQVVLNLGPIEEACPLGLAPTTSAAAMLAMGDSLALVVSRMRRFEAADFARFHPGGSLGFRLSHVEDHMRPLVECRLARDSMTVRAVFSQWSRPGRRTGAVMIVDQANRLVGLFTDSDLARLFERHNEQALDGPVRAVMTPRPFSVTIGTRMSEAIELLSQRRISELPVVDPAGCPLGLIDVTDIMARLPKQAAPAAEQASGKGADGDVPPLAKTA